MVAQHTNPYLVNSKQSISGKVGGSDDNEDTELFYHMEKDTDYFRHLAELAKSDSSGIYNCFFLKNGVLYSGTTRVKPKKGGVSTVTATEIHSFRMALQLDIFSESQDVLWNIRVRR